MANSSRQNFQVFFYFQKKEIVWLWIVFNVQLHHFLIKTQDNFFLCHRVCVPCDQVIGFYYIYLLFLFFKIEKKKEVPVLCLCVCVSVCVSVLVKVGRWRNKARMSRTVDQSGQRWYIYTTIQSRPALKSRIHHRQDRVFSFFIFSRRRPIKKVKNPSRVISIQRRACGYIPLHETKHGSHIVSPEGLELTENGLRHVGRREGGRRPFQTHREEPQRRWHPSSQGYQTTLTRYLNFLLTKLDLILKYPLIDIYYFIRPTKKNLIDGYVDHWRGEKKMNRS